MQPKRVNVILYLLQYITSILVNNSVIFQSHSFLIKSASSTSDHWQTILVFRPIVTMFQKYSIVLVRSGYCDTQVLFRSGCCPTMFGILYHE